MLQTNIEIFKELSRQELDTLTQHSRLKVLDKHQFLCHQHTKAEHAYVLATGTALAERISSEGRRQVLAFIFPGDLIGLTDHHEFSVKALTPTTAHQFLHSRLAKLSDKFPTLSDNLNDVREKVMGLMMDQIYLLGQKNAHERVCYLFVHLLSRLPNANPEHIELPMTRLDMADYLGLTVETVSRSMTKLKNEGLIEITGTHSIAVLNVDTVKELANIK